jgi:hypothetical protein
MTATNKRYSYPRVTAIRIDVHFVVENPTNTPHAFHAQSTYGSQPYVSHTVHIFLELESFSPTALRSGGLVRTVGSSPGG